jgi:GTP-binding protein
MDNRYRTTRFLISAPDPTRLPEDTGREVAFAGRSNAGKSSALNAITEQRRLARISKTPGRTQLLNVFEIAPERRLVDLPGYGYAKVPEPLRRHWGTAIARYLDERQSLAGLILLMDVRHPLMPPDRQLLDWCKARGLPVHILLTKADKFSRGRASATLQAVRRELPSSWPLATVQLFSALKNTGLEQACNQLDAWLFEG